MHSQGKQRRSSLNTILVSSPSCAKWWRRCQGYVHCNGGFKNGRPINTDKTAIPGIKKPHRFWGSTKSHTIKLSSWVPSPAMKKPLQLWHSNTKIWICSTSMTEKRLPQSTNNKLNPLDKTKQTRVKTNQYSPSICIDKSFGMWRPTIWAGRKLVPIPHGEWWVWEAWTLISQELSDWIWKLSLSKEVLEKRGTSKGPH